MPKNGLVPDRYPVVLSSSIAAVGFALTAYPIGVERGYVTRRAATSACSRRCGSFVTRRRDQTAAA